MKLELKSFAIGVLLTVNVLLLLGLNKTPQGLLSDTKYNIASDGSGGVYVIQNTIGMYHGRISHFTKNKYGGKLKTISEWNTLTLESNMSKEMKDLYDKKYK